MVTELSRYNFDLEVISHQFSDDNGFLWLARTVCYSQLNLTSDRLLNDLMWFLCRFRHIRYVESGSFRNLIQFGEVVVFDISGASTIHNDRLTFRPAHDRDFSLQIPESCCIASSSGFGHHSSRELECFYMLLSRSLTL